MPQITRAAEGKAKFTKLGKIKELIGHARTLEEAKKIAAEAGKKKPRFKDLKKRK